MLNQQQYLKTIKTLPLSTHTIKCNKCKLVHSKIAYLKKDGKTYKCCMFCRSMANKRTYPKDELYVKSCLIRNNVNINNITKLYGYQPSVISEAITKKYTKQSNNKLVSNCSVCNDKTDYMLGLMNKKGFFVKDNKITSVCLKCTHSLLKDKKIQSFINVCDKCNTKKKTHNSHLCKDCSYSNYKKVYRKKQKEEKQKLPPIPNFIF